MAINTSYNSQQPINDFGLPFSKIKYSASIPVDVGKTLEIPGKSPRYMAVIRYEQKTGLKLYVSLNVEVTIPSDNSFTDTSTEICPKCRLVKSGDILHFKARDGDIETVDITVVLYSLT